MFNVGAVTSELLLCIGPFLGSVTSPHRPHVQAFLCYLDCLNQDENGAERVDVMMDLSDGEQYLTPRLFIKAHILHILHVEHLYFRPLLFTLAENAENMRPKK